MAILYERSFTAPDGTPWTDAGFRQVLGSMAALVYGNAGHCGSVAEERIFRAALLDGVSPTGENGAVFELMEKVLKMNADPVRELAAAWREELNGTVRDRLEAGREVLRQRGVSGPAAIPNPNRDKALLESVRQGTAIFRERLRERFSD